MKSVKTIALLFAAMLMLAGCGKGPEATAKAALQAMYDGDYDSYEKVWAKPSREEFALGSGFMKLAFDKEKIKPSDFKAKVVESRGDIAFVELSIPGDSDKNMEFKVEKIDGTWKVVDKL